jgi:radical SAM superfamily enzyme YgiQ (UPF0313 family)
VHLRYRSGGKHRRVLSEGEARDVFEEVGRVVRDLRGHASPGAAKRLDAEILPWTPQALLAERERFDAVYAPVSILPPDQYLSVVLQASLGCSWNSCTFCDSFRDRSYAVRGPEEFRAHVTGVRSLLGEGLRLRRGIFLADGNALALSLRRLLPLLDVAREALGPRPIAGFVDLVGGERKSADDWRALADRGLDRVHVGIESGLDALLQWMDKPGSADEQTSFVTTLKAASLKVALIVMVGVGGERYREPHRDATLAALRDMPLAQEDIVYLSPFIEHPASEYARRRQAVGIAPVPEAEVEAELREWALEIRRHGPKATRYDIREMIY